MYGGIIIITRVEAEEIKLQKIMVNDGAVYYGQLVDGQRKDMVMGHIRMPMVINMWETMWRVEGKDGRSEI